MTYTIRNQGTRNKWSAKIWEDSNQCAEDAAALVANFGGSYAIENTVTGEIVEIVEAAQVMPKVEELTTGDTITSRTGAIWTVAGKTAHHYNGDKYTIATHDTSIYSYAKFARMFVTQQQIDTGVYIITKAN